MSKTETRIGLLGYATDEERAALVREREERDSAEAEQQRLTEKAAELEYRASSLHQHAEAERARQRAALVAEALGEGKAPPPATEPATGPGPSELREAAAELRRRAEAMGLEARAAHDRLCSLVYAMFDAYADRAAEDYVEAAARLAALHASIGAVDKFRRERSGRGAGGTIVDPAFFDLTIPGSVALAPLREAAATSGVSGVVVGGDVRMCHMAADRALDAAKAEVRALVGAWPFDRR